MALVEPVALAHSWPLWEQARHLELGHVFNCAITDLIPPIEVGTIGPHHAGCWECDLSNNSLVWSGGVYDIFGLPRGVPVNRDDAVGFYLEDSRAKMERLRTHAIKHRRGFTIDVEVRSSPAGIRWMRLVAAPICIGERSVRLHGLKLAL
jgi:PAS domain-containing protein